MQDAAEWSEELDALRFAVPGHGAFCAVHRLAFKAVLGVSPEREAALAYFHENEAAFTVAALAKIKRSALPAGRSLHLNSRDIRRAMAGEGGDVAPRVCRVLDQG
ncbi:Conserved hypothetical protein [Agrobacterium fabacearum CFBP 5771]|jgi:hypothetical protein|uniref:hypothetical protein n=1 Tax=Rhizobium/Agrobacterium group TaxID=227290 RepID=UPI0004713E78|nr:MULTISPECIES: hypothetical protein [Rhizobium/Agrobacterium group]KQY53401.1 hypothetical protein ASD46_02955 [Rhizobium sp. Root491]MDR5008125.1 hypothetical protein [Agrobacterium tumefaciens]NSY57954.1 hypothetical protein [Agrobacterium tumefaciens]NTZ59429.1 hypothetical protein [Agrobacterium tumefaciens]OMP73032.1 hypothetical protein BV900_07120 [Agrobacterium tumefaciens]